MGLPTECDIGNFELAIQQIDDLYANFVSPYCSPCHALQEKIKAADIKTPIVEISTVDCPNLAVHMDIHATPTVVHLKKGKIVSRFEGISADDIVNGMMAGK